MTKKQEQLAINSEVENFVYYFVEQVLPYKREIKSYRLDNCQAEIIQYENYIALRSYDTIVAVYDKAYNVMYDYLRYVYGYTATSAKHIAKFRNRIRPKKILTWREV